MQWKSGSYPLLVLCLAGAFRADSAAQDVSPFRMEGIVTEEGTQQPVSGATIQVLIESEPVVEKKVRSAKTDASGHYSVELPVGHAWEWNLQPPMGYALVRAHEHEQFATTAEQPVFRKDYQVRKGVAWPILVRAPAEALPLGRTYLSLNQQRDQEHFNAFCEVPPDGSGDVTLPLDASGEFTIQCGDVSYVLAAPEEMKLTVDKGFRTDRVTSIDQVGGGDTLLRDGEGRAAKLHGARAVVKDRTATLVIDMRVRPPTDFSPVVGRVEDAQARPLAGAKVEAAFHSEGGSATSMLTATSDVDGKFRLLIPKRERDMRVALVVTKDGYAGIDTEPREIDFAK